MQQDENNQQNETVSDKKSSKEKLEERKGAEFMSLRCNVIRKRKELRSTLSPRENYLLDDIQEGTIGDWQSLGEFNLEDLAKGLNIRMNKIYVLLKNLHTKDIIVREKTKHKKLEMLGLNPNIFGQILSNHQHGIEKKKHLRLVPNQDAVSPKSGLNESQIRTDLVPKRDQIYLQHNDIIDKKSPLDSYRCLQMSSDAKTQDNSWPESDPKRVRELVKKAVNSLLKELP